ncbi:MAG TPA: hypothetical protein VF707_18885 [Ardenticatenaceae bacterium]|jgi:hypothetical protein
MFVYINYPNPHITIHKNRYCGRIQQGGKPKQRFVKLNVDNMSQELQKFERKEYPFRAAAGFNDIWLEIDLQNEPLEIAVVQKLQQLLGQHYKPLRNCPIRTHC